MQPQQPQLSVDALHMLYRDLGEARHSVYERNIKILAAQAELAEVKAERDALQAELDALKASSEPAGEPTRLRKGG